MTFYLDLGAVTATSYLYEHVRGTESFEAAHAALRRGGYETELDVERELAGER